MATVATQSIGTAGIAATYTAATAADKFAPGDGVFLHVKNANAGAVTVTLATPATVDGLAVDNRMVTIPTGTDRFIAAPESLYRNRADGLADVTISPFASVTFAVLRS